jgi:uncharacterized membrane protein
MSDRTERGHVTVPTAVQRTVAALEQDERLDAIVRRLEPLAAPVSHGTAGSQLRGEWMGHALHPLLTDVPIGCWVSAGLLDLLGGKGSRRAAQRLVGIGIVAATPTVASGLADWSQLRDPRTRRVGAVHALANGVTAFLYVRSWQSRRRGRHLRGIAYGALGAVALSASGYLGGHLAYARRAGTGQRGMDLDGAGARRADGTARDGGTRADAAGDGAELVDLRTASELIGVPVPQLQAMVEEGLLEPAVLSPDLRFRDSDVRALRLLGG